MDPLTIIALATKAVDIAMKLYESGAVEKAITAVGALKTVLVDKKAPTQADLDACEAVLDQLFDEFNADLPPE